MQLQAAVRRMLTRFPLQFCWHIKCLHSEHIDSSNQEQRWRNVLRRCLYSFLFTFPVLTIVSFMFAGANFYILYHITPFFISRLLFHFYMCALLFGIMLALLRPRFYFHVSISDKLWLHIYRSHTFRMYFGIPFSMLTCERSGIERARPV